MESVLLLGTIVSQDLRWELMFLTKRAQQRMKFLRQLRKFYTAIIDSVLTSSITICYAAATAKDNSRG